MTVLERFSKIMAMFFEVSRSNEILGEEFDRLQEKYRQRYTIVGESQGIRTCIAHSEKVSNSKAAILITGDSGTGKELIARAIHYNGSRKDKRFVAIDCGALPENLLENELFGHVKGAFTGATDNKKGLFQMADGGTLFLDEINNTSPALQAKLLRVIEERRVLRVGGLESHAIDVRFVAATNRDPEREVERVLGRGGDHADVMQHFLHGHAQRVLAPHDGHGAGIADKNRVDLTLVHELGGWIIVGGEHGGPMRGQLLSFLRLHFYFQHTQGGLDHAVLQREHVPGILRNSLRPQLPGGARIRQYEIDAHRVASALPGGLQHQVGSQFLAGLFEGGHLLGSHFAGGNHLQRSSASQPGELGGHCFVQTIGFGLVVRPAPDGLEGEHHHIFLLGDGTQPDPAQQGLIDGGNDRYPD
ncbi:MAG: sigma-54 factor interaction domain-containing protein [Acidobacteria bacterium]|nr:sigma-54 factor interaction domain-containing protein [Acidobacteriota bacterium]